jgi:hypothetical protein
MQIEQSCAVGSHSEEEGMPEIHLADKAGKQIPTRSEYGKDTGKSKDTQEIDIFGKHRQEEQKEKEEHDDDTGWENEHFVFKYGKQLSQVK